MAVRIEVARKDNARKSSGLKLRLNEKLQDE